MGMTRWEREKRLRSLGIVGWDEPLPGEVPATPDDDGWTPWVQCDSSNVSEIRYHESQQLLQVWFKNSAVYEYRSVERDVWVAFVEAPSKGRFVWERLRGFGRGAVYPYRRVA